MAPDDFIATAPASSASASGVRASSLNVPVVALFVLSILTTIVYPAYLLTADREGVVSIVSDDAYYYFNVAVNIAQGNGPTADGVTKTTGFHPLYAFLLAGLHKLTTPSLDGFVREAIALNALCFAANGLFIGLAARRFAGSPAGIIAALLWWTNPHAALVSAIGLEGSIFAMTMSLVLWRLAVLTRSAPTQIGTWLIHAAVLGLCMGITLLARTDSLVLAALVGIILITAAPAPFSTRIAGALLFGTVSAACLALWWWYAWKHTGSVVQGSAAIKQLWRPEVVADEYGRYALGTSLLFAASVYAKYLLKCFLKIPALKWSISAIPALFSSTGNARPPRLLLHLCWVLPASLGVAYASMIDRPRTWYYVPALLMLTFVTALAASHIITRPPSNGLMATARRLLPFLAWLVVIESAAIFGRNAIYGRSSEQVTGLRGAQWISENIDPGERIGCWHSGIVQYYTPNHTVINLDGLANNEILPVLRRDMTMNDYWDKRGITLILGEPRQKMGSYAREWNGKKLDPIENGVQRVVPAALESHGQ